MKIQEKLYLNTARRYFHKSSRREFAERKQKKMESWIIKSNYFRNDSQRLRTTVSAFGITLSQDKNGQFRMDVSGRTLIIEDNDMRLDEHASPKIQGL